MKKFFTVAIVCLTCSISEAGPIVLYNGSNVEVGTSTNPLKVSCVGDSCGSGSGASSLSGLSDVGTATATAGSILVGDGDSFESVAVSGDATLSGAGVVIIQDQQKCFALESPTTGDVNIPVLFPTYGITISGGYCATVGGTSASIKLTDGTNDMTTIVCDSDGATSGFSLNNTFNANEAVKFTASAVSESVTWVSYCFTYERTP